MKYYTGEGLEVDHQGGRDDFTEKDRNDYEIQKQFLGIYFTI